MPRVENIQVRTYKSAAEMRAHYAAVHTVMFGEPVPVPRPIAKPSVDAVDLIDGSAAAAGASFTEIAAVVCRYFKISHNELVGDVTRQPHIVRPRQIMVALASVLTRMNMADIAHLIGRDPSTIRSTIVNSKPIADMLVQTMSEGATVLQWVKEMDRQMNMQRRPAVNQRRDRPVSFAPEMTQALSLGRKTMMRRLAWDEDSQELFLHLSDERRATYQAQGYQVSKTDAGTWRLAWPSAWHGTRPGDRLWVKEGLRRDKAGWRFVGDNELVTPTDERATAWLAGEHADTVALNHMPRVLSRFTLHVQAVEVQRLHAITNKDCFAEGVQFDGLYDFKLGDTIRGNDPGHCFATYWQRLNGQALWRTNPEVVVISFRAEKANIDQTVEEAA